jgi:opacity protein-like surface antigen
VKDQGLNRTAKTDVGFRAGAGVGYGLTKDISVEFDTGYLWNPLKDSDSSISHVPLILQAIFHVPLTGRWDGYIGGGAGGSYSILKIDEGAVNDSGNDFEFAWQATAGVRYKIKPNMSLGLGYKYFGVSGSNFDIEHANVHTDVMHNHTAEVVFSMKF